MRVNSSGGSAPSTCSANQASRLAGSIASSRCSPTGSFRCVASSAMATHPMRGGAGYTGLLIDFGGVLTTSVWDSFAQFCRREGLKEDAVKRLFRDDPGALADLRGLETGEVDEREFEERFAKRLGLAECRG